MRKLGADVLHQNERVNYREKDNTGSRRSNTGEGEGHPTMMAASQAWGRHFKEIELVMHLYFLRNDLDNWRKTWGWISEKHMENQESKGTPITSKETKGFSRKEM